MLAGVATGLAAACTRQRRVVWIATVCALAYGSHVLLDWLGADQSRPPGVMALWPLTKDHYISGLNLFFSPSWSFWDTRQFIIGNVRYLAREQLVMIPIFLGIVLLQARTRQPWSRPSMGHRVNDDVDGERVAVG